MDEENKYFENIRLRGKFYDENQFPVQDELVMAKCISCEENGSYVQLLEYEGKKGMIPINEFSKSMKKSIQRSMKVGKVDVVRVLRVDAQKGYIDLSKNKVSVQEEAICLDRFAKAKSIHSIVMHLSKALKIEIKQLYEIIVRPLYENKSTLHPLDQLKNMMIKEDKINELNIKDEALKKGLIEEIKRRFKRPVLKSLSIFKLAAKGFDGIVQIKEILKAGITASKDKNFDVKITILGAPDYLCEVTTATKEDGEIAIMTALDRIREQCEKFQGEFEIKEKPKVVGEKDANIQDLYKVEEEMVDDEDSDMGDDDDEAYN